jgi:NAD(P)-dependent dehydrogenase (short-subunit alcohol dehydrogenase family)
MAGIAALAIIASAELGRYGVTVNAIAPAALTRMTENLGGSFAPKEETQAQMDPQWVANVVTWLASGESRDWTGRVIETSGLRTAVAQGWHRGPNSDTPADTPAGVRDVLVPLLEAAEPPRMIGP